MNFSFSKFKWTSILVLFLLSNISKSQSKFSGDWEGVFMKDFRVIINLNSSDDKSFTGKILMFSGSDQIQNDKISEIDLNGNNLTFLIKAKETLFKGVFNEEVTELSGNFIFPDGSEHPLVVHKEAKVVQQGIASEEKFIELKNKKYPVEQLKEDLNFLIDKLKELHPQLYSYTSKESFEDIWNKTNISINSDLTLEEYFTLIAPVVEKVNCSHTGIRLPQNYLQGVDEYGNFLPIKLSIINDKAYYLSNYCNTDQMISPGSEIVSINNYPIDDIITDLQKYIPSEGNNTTTKYNELNQNFNSYYYLYDNSKTYNVEFLSPDSGKKIISLSACNFNDFVLDDKPGSDSPVEFKLDEENSIAFLKIRSFAFPDIKEYIQQMDQTFEFLKSKNIQNLVLDLRDNKGGHPIFAAQLFSYLTDKDFIYFKRNKDVKDFEPLYNTMQPNKLNFHGKVYVFINGGCLSTTGHLISLIQYHTDAVFIGEDPGSSFYCNDHSIRVTLPNTGIEVNIPRTTFETATSGFSKEEPFSLDYKVNNSLKDVLNGVDIFNESLYKLIEK
ncbi:MAG: S41 family peptidase [Bacteroidota bacterium]